MKFNILKSNNKGFANIAFVSAVGVASLYVILSQNSTVESFYKTIVKKMDRVKIKQTENIILSALSSRFRCEINFKNLPLSSLPSGQLTVGPITNLHYGVTNDPSLPGREILTVNGKLDNFTINSINFVTTEPVLTAGDNQSFYSSLRINVSDESQKFNHTIDMPAYIVTDASGSHIQSCYLTVYNKNKITLEDIFCQVDLGPNYVYSPKNNFCSVKISAGP